MHPSERDPHTQPSPRGWYAIAGAGLWRGLLVAVWTALVTAGWYLATAYEFETDPQQAGASSEWPATSRIARPVDRCALLVFLHPKCPCSYATVGELEHALRSVAASGQQGPEVIVVACVPRAAESEWAGTPLVERADGLPRSTVYVDVDGAEAKRFAATTSGTVVLVTTEGRRVYQGGVTQARGHAGRNVGAEAIVALLKGDSARGDVSPVLGCRLVQSAEPVAASDLTAAVGRK